MRVGRKGPRPNTWKIQGEIPHQQHIAWHRMRAQAVFRGEPWQFEFNQFQEVWNSHWHLRGRGSEEYCLVRIDYDLPWSTDNVELIQRRQHAQRQRQRQREIRLSRK
jgi:hypothetical protein